MGLAPTPFIINELKRPFFPFNNATIPHTSKINCVSISVNVFKPVLLFIQFKGEASTTPPSEITSCSFKNGELKNRDVSN